MIYLDFSKTRKNIPAALFVNGNCSLNIRNGDAFKSPFGSQKDKEISNAIFGKGPKDPSTLGSAVYKRYGDGQDGFNIVSSQFTMHYFFETLETLHNFIRNLAECTKLNGYFIGTCYDGDKVFNLLSDKQKNESFRILNKGGGFYCLEFYKVDKPLISNLYKLYSKTIPLFGKIFNQNSNPYKYLVKSIEDFYPQNEISKKLIKAGFKNVNFKNIFGGIASIHYAWKLND